MGRIKDHFHEYLCEHANDEPLGPEPDELEMFRQAANDAYMSLLSRVPDAYHRTKEQQRLVDDLLSRKLKATYAVLHHGL